jgi:hypothetical protein
MLRVKVLEKNSRQAVLNRSLVVSNQEPPEHVHLLPNIFYQNLHSLNITVKIPCHFQHAVTADLKQLGISNT